MARVPFQNQIGTLAEPQPEEQFGDTEFFHVPIGEIERTAPSALIATVQSMYKFDDRSADEVVDFAETAGTAVVP